MQQFIQGHTMGLPCAHAIKETMEVPGTKIRLQDIHSHWQYRRVASRSPLVSDIGPLSNDPHSQQASIRSSFNDDVEDHAFPDASFSHLSEPNFDFDLPDLSQIIGRGTQVPDAHAASPLSISSNTPSVDSLASDLLEINEPSISKPKGRQ